MGLLRLRALSLLLKRTPPAALSPSVTLMRAPGLKAGRYSGTIECWMQTFQDASANLCKKQLYLIAWTLDHCCSEVLRLIHHSQQRCKVFPTSPNWVRVVWRYLASFSSASSIISIIFHILWIFHLSISPLLSLTLLNCLYHTNLCQTWLCFYNFDGLGTVKFLPTKSLSIKFIFYFRRKITTTSSMLPHVVQCSAM